MSRSSKSSGRSREAPLCSLLLAVAFSLAGCRAAPQRDLLLITLDTTRADRLGCYGYSKNTSPVLDGLAAQAVVFDLAIAQAAVTPVSHASILTGLDPYHHGLRVMHGLTDHRLDDSIDTLAEVWGRAGGRSAAFISAYPAGADFGLAQGFDHFDAEFEPADELEPVDDRGVVNTGSSQRRADDTTTATLKWLRSTAEDERPVLVWVHYFDPHDAVIAPPAQIRDKFPPPSAARADVLRALYDAEIFFVDAQIGRLLDSWRNLRSWDQSVVAIVADHGEGLGDHDWWSHGILYQEQIRVPLILRAPGLEGGRRFPALTPTTDLMPTLLELAGVPSSRWPRMDGTSRVDALRGRLSESRFAYSDSINILDYLRPDDPGMWDRKLDKLYSLTDGRHKLIYHQLHPEATEFFDLLLDPGEISNLAPSKPPEMAPLLARLEEMRPFSDITPGTATTDQERLERLESLGYVE